LKEERALGERISLLEKELVMLTEKLEETSASLEEIEDLKLEIKGLKLFLGRAYPDFKSKFPEIMKKIYKK
jgi:hypothetical protein